MFTEKQNLLYAYELTRRKLWCDVYFELIKQCDAVPERATEKAIEAYDKKFKDNLKSFIGE